MRMRSRRLAAALLAALGAAAPLAGQSDSVAPAVRTPALASPLLPAGHWSLTAARRAEGMGLAPDYFPAQAGASRAEVADALRQAVQQADRGSVAGRLALQWLTRFLEEFPEEREPTAAGLTWLGGGAGARFDRDQGRVAPAIGVYLDRTDPAPLEDVSTASATLRGGIRLGGALAGWASLAASDEAVEAREWEAVARLGPVALSVGRSTIQYGSSGQPGLVLGSAAALPRVEARSTRAWHPGGILRPLGRMTAHTFLAPLDEDRHVTSPWLWGARVAFRPHGRVTIAVNRASIFGGDSARPTPRRVGGMLLGVLSEGFENQLVSVDGRYRLPTEQALPLTVYAEWAADDGAGAWVEQPAMMGGLEVPGFPGAPNLSVAAEVAWFAACCGHGAWYNHDKFWGHWADRDQPLGHPLGGEGTEVALRFAGDFLDARVRLHGRGFFRDRSDASLRNLSGGGNLYAYPRAGESHGGMLDASVRLGPRVELGVRASGERGDGWRQSTLELEMRSLF
jgi:hypothetical protein